MATITINVNDKELWSAVFGSSFELVGNWWAGVSYGPFTDWETPGTVDLTIDDPAEPEGSGKTITKTVSIDELAAGFSRLLQEFQFDFTVRDLDFDSVSGDALLQLVVLGDIVYG